MLQLYAVHHGGPKIVEWPPFELELASISILLLHIFCRFNEAALRIHTNPTLVSPRTPVVRIGHTIVTTVQHQREV